MTNYSSSNLIFSAIKNGFRENYTNTSQVFTPQPGAFDITVPPSEFFYYEMRGKDIDCITPTYRYWTVVGAPDSTGALYVGAKCGISPLSNICIVRRYIAG